MSTNLLILILAGIGLGIAFIIEDSREFILEGLEAGWDSVVEIFSASFDDIGSFSFTGIAFAIIGVGMIYCTRYLNLNGSGLGSIEAMTQYMPPVQRLIWTVLSYVAVAVACYFVGKGFENS